MLKLMFVIVFCICAFFSLGCAWDGSGDALPSPVACLNCTICEYPCQPLPPPDSGAPLPPPPPLPEYPAPPPPVPGYPRGKCPPTPGVQCCQYTPPSPPYGIYSPYENHAYSLTFPIFLYVVVIVILLFSSAA